MDVQEKMLIKVTTNKVAIKEGFEVVGGMMGKPLLRVAAKDFAKNVCARYYAGEGYKCEFDFGDPNDTANDDQEIWVVSCYDITD